MGKLFHINFNDRVWRILDCSCENWVSFLLFRSLLNYLILLQSGVLHRSGKFVLKRVGNWCNNLELHTVNFGKFT